MIGGMRRSARSGLLLACVAFAAAGPSGCGGGSNDSSPTTNSGGSTKLQPPAFAKTVNLRPASGKILVELPATGRFVQLSTARQVPVGTLVDASAGVVRLTAATPNPGHVEAGDFQAGIFEVRQDPAERGLTELRIRDDEAVRKACGSARGRNTGRQPSKLLSGRLLGIATGRFRTRGRFSSATVRGTNWGVRNRCDGTLTIVRRGVVVVTDFGRHKDFVVRAGHSFLAKAR